MARPRCTFFFSIALTGAFLCGCKVDQQKEVERYQSVLHANLLSNEKPFLPGEAMTLRQALDLSNRQNERLAVEGENYVQALVERKRAAAAFQPTVNLAPIYSVQQNVNSNANNNANNNNNNSYFDAPLSGQINLFNGFSDVARSNRTAETAERQRNLLLNLQEAVLLETASVYYLVLRAEQSVEVLHSSLDVQEARVRDITGRQKAGLARPLDVAQTEAQASGTRVTLINAINDVRNGRATLAFLTAAPVGDAPLVDRFDAPANLPTLDQLKESAAAQRRDYLAAQAATRAARQDVEVAVGQYYPSVTLNASLFLYRESFPDERMWDALLVANLPIFSAGLIEADVRQAWSRFRQAGMSESLLRRQVAQDVQLAYQDLVSAGSRIDELIVQVAAAQQAFNQADRSYTVGLATNLERVTAQGQLLNAQLQLTSARFDRTLSYLSLARATGALRKQLETTTSAPPATVPTTVPAEQRPLGSAM